MFQFPGFAFLAEYSMRSGLPHSEIAGSKLIRSSPTLIAAYHVLHRLLSPRHPPNALKTLDHSHYQCSSFSRQRRKKMIPCALPLFELLERVKHPNNLRTGHTNDHHGLHLHLPDTRVPFTLESQQASTQTVIDILRPVSRDFSDSHAVTLAHYLIVEPWIS